MIAPDKSSEREHRVRTDQPRPGGRKIEGLNLGALVRWAYDDSTISKWYGLGFVWFLIRFALMLLLLIPDLLLTLVYLLAGGAFLFFGSTGQNVVYGLAALLTLLVVTGIVAFVRYG